jgi:hypothetical protein
MNNFLNTVITTSVNVSAAIFGVAVGILAFAAALVMTAASLVAADLTTIGFGALYTWPLWNYVLRPVFPYVTEINFLQALGLVTLAHIIFKAKAYVAPKKSSTERLLDDLIAASGGAACNDPKRGCNTGPKRPVSEASR